MSDSQEGKPQGEGLSEFEQKRLEDDALRQAGEISRELLGGRNAEDVLEEGYRGAGIVGEPRISDADLTTQITEGDYKPELIDPNTLRPIEPED